MKKVKKFEPGRGYSRKDWEEVSDNPELTDAQLKQGKPFAEVFPELASIKRSRGRPRIEKPKQAVTLRVNQDTLNRFKARGKDWRAEMSKALDASGRRKKA